MKYLILLLFASALPSKLFSQNKAVALDWQNQIDFEQNRFDILDGDLDGKITLSNEHQSTIATKLYLERIRFVSIPNQVA
jgi:hypothetical protein